MSAASSVSSKEEMSTNHGSSATVTATASAAATPNNNDAIRLKLEKISEVFAAFQKAEDELMEEVGIYDYEFTVRLLFSDGKEFKFEQSIKDHTWKKVSTEETNELFKSCNIGDFSMETANLLSDAAKYLKNYGQLSEDISEDIYERYKISRIEVENKLFVKESYQSYRLLRKQFESTCGSQSIEIDAKQWHQIVLSENSTDPNKSCYKRLYLNNSTKTLVFDLLSVYRHTNSWRQLSAKQLFYLIESLVSPELIMDKTMRLASLNFCSIINRNISEHISHYTEPMKECSAYLLRIIQYIEMINNYANIALKTLEEEWKLETEQIKQDAIKKLQQLAMSATTELKPLIQSLLKEMGTAVDAEESIKSLESKFKKSALKYHPDRVPISEKDVASAKFTAISNLLAEIKLKWERFPSIQKIIMI